MLGLGHAAAYTSCQGLRSADHMCTELDAATGLSSPSNRIEITFPCCLCFCLPACGSVGLVLALALPCTSPPRPPPLLVHNGGGEGHWRIARKGE